MFTVLYNHIVSMLPASGFVSLRFPWITVMQCTMSIYMVFVLSFAAVSVTLVHSHKLVADTGNCSISAAFDIFPFIRVNPVILNLEKKNH